MQCTASSANTNTMPRCSGIATRCISPVWRASAVWATSASMRYIPAPSSATGRRAVTPCAAADKAAVQSTAKMEARRREERFFIAEQAR